MARIENLSSTDKHELDPAFTIGNDCSMGWNEDFLYTLRREGYTAPEFPVQRSSDADSNSGPVCYLDYLLVWLEKGRASLFFTTYEEWLLAIIMVADDLYSAHRQHVAGNPGSPAGFKEYLDVQEGSNLGLLDWGEPTFEFKMSKIAEDPSFERIRFDPKGGSGAKHPALTREVYDDCRKDALERSRLRDERIAQLISGASNV